MVHGMNEIKGKALLLAVLCEVKKEHLTWRTRSSFSPFLNIYQRLRLLSFFIYIGVRRLHTTFLVKHEFHCCHTRVNVCGNNLNIVSMCAVSPVVYTSNISGCQKELFRFSCGC